MGLHSVKKAAANMKASSMPENAEFTSLKAQLDGLYKFLETNNNNIAELGSKWTALANDTKKMTENYASLYPETDAVKPAAKEASSAAAKSAGRAAGIESGEKVGTIVKTIKKYLTELSALNPEYAKLADAKVEYEMYKSKTEGLEGAKKKDAEKIERNQGKTEAAKISYEGSLDSTVVRMKALWAKRGPVLKASLTAFWLAQSGHVAQLTEDLAVPTKFAADNEAAMVKLDISAIKIESVTPPGEAPAAPAPIAA